MSKMFLRFNGVTFGYEKSLNNLFENVSIHISNGWTGVTGVNGAGKTTLLKLACGLLNEYQGTIEKPGDMFYNEQRTDVLPDILRDFIDSYDKYSFQLINKLAIESDWINRWNTLSHGERKRVQLACALWKQPELLAVDEPTNHLDSESKAIIIDALKSFKGIGLIVSHDRELMESLCTQIVFVEPPEVTLRHGKLSEALEQKKMENEYAQKNLDLKKQELNKLEKEFRRRSDEADKSKRKSSKRFIDRKDHDAKSKIDLGRLTGKDAVGGRLKRQMASRIDNAAEELNNITIKREYETGITLSESVSKRNFLLKVNSGTLKLSDQKVLHYKDLIINPTDRISLTGINGSGKSSLLKHLVNLINADADNITYIPQEISIEKTKDIINEINKMPNDKLGKLMIIISRLGSDAKRVLDTEIPSPGETRKLLLGLGITKNPHIIIMDEPTNHMDLVSIECLEDALKNVNCALLLVSHDKRFLGSITTVNWNIVMTKGGYRME